MNRWLALALVAAMLAVPAASVGAWPQAGYDAARTGHVPDTGPAWNDTAINVTLPGVAEGMFTGTGAEPLILDGDAYVAVRPGGGDRGLDGQGIVRVNLSTADVELFIEMDEAPETMASADGRLFVTRDGGVEAYEVDTGDRLWSAPTPTQTADPAMTVCFSPAVREGLLVVPCTEIEGGTVGGGAPATGEPVRTIPFLVAYDAETGDMAAYQSLDRQREAQASSPGSEDAHTPTMRAVIGVTTIGPYIMPVTLDVFNPGGSHWTDVSGTRASTEEFRLTLWGFEDDWGLQWVNSTETRRDSRVTLWVQETINEDRETGGDSPPVAPHVTGTPGEVYTKLDGTITALNPAQGNDLWSQPLGSRDAESSEGGMDSALSGDSLFAASTQSLYRFDVTEPRQEWSFSLPPTADAEFGWGTIIAAEDTVYAMTTDWSAGGSLYAVDADDGTLQWSEELPPAPGESSALFAYSLGEGVIVVAGDDGSFRVFGQTDASPTPRVEASDAMPGAGEAVAVNLSGSEPGLEGPVTRYKAIWGDGNETDWQADPVLNHTYEEEGEVTARFVVGNDADQTASTTQTFHVGQEAPTEPNWIEERFQKDNQDMTFGVLGLAVALGGGAIGVARRKRKQSILQEELETLEEGFEDSRDNPGECEAFLDTRKARARSLMMDGTLDEEQFGVLESRIEELHGELRTSVLDSRFEFLPHGMVQSLKKMLADGKISTWEREAVETLLEDEDALNEAQKEKVRHQLQRWFAEDTGGEAP